MSEIFAALLGALAAGGFQTIFSIIDRQRMRRSTLIAIAAEVQSLCILIRHQGYLEAFHKKLRDIESNAWDGSGWIMDIRSHYFSVFESNSNNLSILKPDHVVMIVRFYGYCKSAIDCTRPDGPFAGDVRPEDAEGNIRAVVSILTKILQLGDDIAQLPQNPMLPSVADV
ncbi:hypothetical protein [Sphingobium yanoikuyae]|uniref:hypothetical protein n=1 Tax=Sphingobium yanoikuyae TaxID=13690 RepID=UPI00345E7F5A